MRVILVPLAGDAGDQVALAAAGRLARLGHGHIDAVFLRPEPGELMPILGEGMSPELIDSVIQAATETWDARRKVARAAYDACLSAASLIEAAEPSARADSEPSLRWLEVTGSATALALDHGRLADLIVLLRAERDDLDRQQILEAMLFNTGRPLLLATQRLGEAPLERIAIAWSGSLEAARAVAAALPLLRQAKAVQVLTAPQGEAAATSPERLCDYLRWHGLHPSAVQLPDAGANLGPALQAAARAHGADLLVMGGYGHSRVRELIFGGVTRHMLNQPDLAVLLAH